LRAAAVVRKGKPGGEGCLMGKRTKTNCKNGDETEMCLRKRKTGRDVQRARNGTWDIMRAKKESETEEPVRSLGTSNGTWDIMREKKESETEEPVRRLATSRENRRESSGNAIDFER